LPGDTSDDGGEGREGLEEAGGPGRRDSPEWRGAATRGSVRSGERSYVDDILPILKSVKDYLNSRFSMKDLGEAAYILGIKIYRDVSNHLLALSQSTYL
jgi:hypothetical protein